MSTESVDIQCPVCGFYCLGNGGIGCIDKPSTIQKDARMARQKPISGKWPNIGDLLSFKPWNKKDV